MSRFFFLLQCRAHHCSSDGQEVEKKTATSRQRGKPFKTTQSNYTMSRNLPRTWLSFLPFIWRKKFPLCFRQVLDHPSKVLYEPETESLFLPLFWFYPIYRELLNTSSRHRPSKYTELRRAASGLLQAAHACPGGP